MSAWGTGKPYRSPENRSPPSRPLFAIACDRIGGPGVAPGKALVRSVPGKMAFFAIGHVSYDSSSHSAIALLAIANARLAVGTPA
jgi:hypothetical protein